MKVDMNLFDKKTVKEYLQAPGEEELISWVLEHNQHLKREEIKIENEGYFLIVALRYAKEKYPEAQELDRASFATVVAGYTTGLFGGFGTDWYWKEKLAHELIALKFGGWYNDALGLGFLPPETQKITPDATKEILIILEELYFGDAQSVMFTYQLLKE
jgi:hypothetical protein